MRQPLVQQSSNMGVLQGAILLLTLATAGIHFYLVTEPEEELRFWFLLNALGYLALLVAYILPRFASYHRLVRYLLMGYTALTILLWVFLGQPYETLGYINKGVELVLLALLFVDEWQERSRGMHHIASGS